MVRLAMAWAPAVMYMSLIWALSSIQLPGVRVEDLPFKDKGVHFVEYAVLGFFAAHAIRATWRGRSESRVYLVAVLWAVGWGVLDEFHQAFVPGRDGDVYDLLADGLGAATGAAALIVFHRLRERRRTRSRM
jgi:VanZ family protein